MRSNLALLCHALAFGRDCHLADLALAMPLLECRLSREQRLQRLLQNEHVSVPLGFDLEASQIRDPGSLEHLLLGMALTTVWLIHIGEWLVRSGQRRTFARRAGDYSLFRLDRDYLARTRIVPGPIPVGLTLTG